MYSIAGPLISRSAHCAGVPFARRGYHPMGTETERLSSRSIDSVSSVTSTFKTLADVATAEFVPLISQ
jgi:hypothetical protein